MFPASFDYFRADSVDAALALLGEHPDAKLLAGGHSLLPMMKLRLAQPSALIDIGRIDALRGVSAQDGGVRIGALTTHHELATSSVLAEHCPLVSEAAAEIGDPQVRNRGTIGGSIAHADPASDLPAVLRAVGATMVIAGSAGERRVGGDDFFVGLLTTAVGEGELLTAVEVPSLAGRGSAYVKHEQPASGYALCGAAAVVGGGSVSLCFNGVSEAPHRATSVENALAGSSLDDAAITAALEGLSIDDPLEDLHASGDYRVHLARVYGRRALQAARDRAA